MVILFIFIMTPQNAILAVLDNEMFSKKMVMIWDRSWDEQVKCLLNDLCCILGDQGYKSKFVGSNRTTVSDKEYGIFKIGIRPYTSLGGGGDSPGEWGV